MQPQTATREGLPSFDEIKVARRFARMVEQYWAEQGHPNVRCCVQRIAKGRNRHAGYEIRSNLLRGLPPLG
jgi:hypothetical protein